MKRSKNIFNSPIGPESLYEEEGNRDFKVGGKNISSNWLVGIDSSEYQKYILSALHLSQLQRQLDQKKQQDHNSPLKNSNLFKIANIKKKIDNFTVLQEIQKQKPLGDQALQNNEPPDTTNLLFQKISQGFFKSLIERKCKIQDKQLFIQSKKDEKYPWTKVGIEKYGIELESKQKPLNKVAFASFTWIQNQTHRLLLEGPELRFYCIYGKDDQLRKLQRYFQVQNIEVKQLGVFKKLDTQFQQKIITLFGNKVRFYDHNIRMRKAEKQSQNQMIRNQVEKIDQKKEFMSPIKVIKEASSQVGQSSEVGQSSDLAQSSVLEKSANLNNQKIFQSSQLGSEIILDGLRSAMGKSKPYFENKEKKGSQLFKLKVKSSTVFYDEIDEPFHFQEGEGYTVGDLKLNLKDEIGISDVDEQSESKSGISHRMESRKMKVIHLSLKSSINESEKYNINIHEVSSRILSQVEFQPQKLMANDDDFHSSPNKSFQLPEQSLKSSFSQGESESFKKNSLTRMALKKHSQIDLIMDEFQLEIDGGKENFQHQSQPNSIKSSYSKHKEKVLIRDFKKGKPAQTEIVQNPKVTTTYFALQQVEMFMPYHLETIRFQILQIDPNLEMQNKIVVCSRTSGVLYQQKQKQRYTFYSIEGGHHFRISSQSDQFIFLLRQESKCHYLRFSVDPNPKYQRNCSQLIITHLDNQGFPFACSLGLFSSPNPIKLRPPLSTIQFMQRYLNQGQDYDFKMDFIDDKRKRYLIRRQWHKRLINETVKEGNAESFSRVVFLGMSDSIFKKLKKNFSYDSKKLFIFSENELRMMEENIISSGVMDLRSFMKPSSLIKYMSQAAYNILLKERLEHIYVYFLNRYGSTRNLSLVFIKQVLNKIESIVVQGRKEEQVFAIIDLYFQIEYQIDDLFLQISKYFKK